VFTQFAPVLKLGTTVTPLVESYSQLAASSS
jgi:hypothetical protein